MIRQSQILRQRKTGPQTGKLSPGPRCASFCYILDFGEPADPSAIRFEGAVPVAVPEPPPLGLRGGMSTLRRGLAIVQTNYPELLDTIYILNAGLGFRLTWSVVQAWMDRRTRGKFAVLKGGPA